MAKIETCEDCQACGEKPDVYDRYRCEVRAMWVRLHWWACEKFKSKDEEG